ncbi:phosphoribosyl transferase [Chlorella sorokiniana]|uniref:Phosphoribosyl transferase n=1 Tax=Chlorella sorokiniana TaxID=3076 RepID=A0A2P6U288_CHLSO|nr:phosphoribosyl transferase [Chlorella sorokiniana]|eukprot:PRW60427.1 phosphoribosyl transferase [Chlorella sorokiniana]
MAPKRDAGGSCRTVADVQQLETLLSTGEKKVKNLGLSFSNNIFKRAQARSRGGREAFEKCEQINQESDTMRDQSAADHAQKKKELAARKQALVRKVATTGTALAELPSVQEEAAHMFAQLRAKMVDAPGGGGEGEAGPAAKRRKQVAFQPKPPQQKQRGA